MRNTVDTVVRGSIPAVRGASRAWIGAAAIPHGGWVVLFHKLPRAGRISRCLVGDPSELARFIFERWGHMRWWSHGALGSKGRLEGGQYLAGRRAPPLRRR
ncbi:MAG TPA: hypothetical protein VK869_14530 [Rubrobacteraceae bacterium]|nr:hypothetical protein [Rubrobacteraceae bacterium]